MTNSISHSIPCVTLAGRRNVGKSSLLNALCRKRYAITDETPGLTRDILEVEIKHKGCHFFLHDTPGLDVEGADDLTKKIRERTQSHLSAMDLIVLVLAAPAPVPFDLDFIQFIRKHRGKTPILFVVNKVDNKENAEDILLPFYEAKLEHLLALSARGRWNLDALLDAIGEKLDQGQTQDKNNRTQSSPQTNDAPQNKRSELRVAIVGRPNAGKSSLFNRIAGQDKALVSPIPGTTRDSLDTLIRYSDKTIRLIDTAGMRKPSRLLAPQNRVEFYSLSRTKRAIRQAMVVILVVDGLVGLTDFDKRICSMIQKYRCAVVFALSKWDAVKEKTDANKARTELKERIAFLFPHIHNLPLIFYSAFTGQGAAHILDSILELEKGMHTQIATAELNTCLKKWHRNLPPSGRNLKVFYAAQVETAPPVFVFFVNEPKFFPPALRSYFENCIRKQYGLRGIPIDIRVRRRV